MRRLRLGSLVFLLALSASTSAQTPDAEKPAPEQKPLVQAIEKLSEAIAGLEPDARPEKVTLPEKELTAAIERVQKIHAQVQRLIAESKAPGETPPAVGGAREAGTPVAEADSPAQVVTMTNSLNFEPNKVTIRAGETVEWRNVSRLVHTVTADEELAKDPSHVHLPEGATPFNSGGVPPGGTYRHTFTVPGMYQYFCIPHETAGMYGFVEVRP